MTTTPDRSTRWLDDREQRAWRGLLTMKSELDAHLRRSLARSSGLSDADYGVLVNLSEAPEDRLRVFELVRSLQWEKSRLSHQLRRMEQRGLVVRTDCDTDGRGAFVALSPAGRAAVTEAAPQHVAEVRRHFADVLTEDQLDELIRITAAVTASLRAASPEAAPAGAVDDPTDETVP